MPRKAPPIPGVGVGPARPPAGSYVDLDYTETIGGHVSDMAPMGRIVPRTQSAARVRAAMEERRAAFHGYLVGLIWWSVMCAALIVFMSGCTTAPVRGVYVGPYDITLTSHREAVFGR